MLAGAGVWVDATLTLMMTATAVPMPTACHFMVFLHGARSAPTFSEHYRLPLAKRRALNEWIRSSKACDAVIDFDKATRDPNDPKKFAAAYDSFDHLH
jgi:hypothetical protein